MTKIFSDAGPFAENQEYYWRVRGKNKAGLGQYSGREYATPNPVVIVDPPPPPPPPPGNTVPESIIISLGFEGFAEQQILTTLGSSPNRFSPSVSGSLGPANPCVPNIASDRTYHGSRAVKFEIPGNNIGGDPTKRRSEIVAADSPNYTQALINAGILHWVGFAVFIPSAGFNDGLTSTLIQTHTRTNEPGQSPVWAIRVTDTNFRLTQEVTGTTFGALSFGDLASVRNTWIRFVIEVFTHPGSSGYIRIWMNDVLVAQRLNTATVEPGTTRHPNYKLGLYASSMQYNNANTRTAWIDAFRVTNAQGNYATVNPASYIGT